MKKRAVTLAPKDERLVDLTFQNVPESLLTEFAEKIVSPYFGGNLNLAFQDLLQKALSEQDFVFSHIIAIRGSVGA